MYERCGAMVDRCSDSSKRAFVARCRESPEDDIAERVIRSHATFLNQIRIGVSEFIFPNEQSSLYGLPIRYVNSSRGNLTFVRRDLVSVGHLPVVLARVYDSSMRIGQTSVSARVAAAETITRQSDGEITYIDDSGSTIALTRTGSGYVSVTQLQLTSNQSGRGSEVRIRLRSGWSKDFSRVRDSFVLTAVRDAHGNALSFIYEGARLSRIEGQNGRFFRST